MPRDVSESWCSQIKTKNEKTTGEFPRRVERVPTIPLRAPPGILKDHSAPARGSVWVKMAVCVCAWSLSRVQLFAKPASLSMGILRQECWSGLPCPPRGGEGVFPTQGPNPGLPHCRRILYQLSHQGSPHTAISDS